MGMPAFKLLADDEIKRARLVTISNGVTPLLATNYLSHFTDHSVNHSDRLCDLVDHLAASLDDLKRLSSVEAAVLYAACYFHDAGMQHERAGETQVVSTLLVGEPYHGQQWSALDLKTRREIVRAQHHRISEEFVRDSVRAGDPVIGTSLNDDDKPGIVAALCRAHCLPTDTEDYRSATADQGGLRVGLLSALLRLADILDESQHRSHLNLERTRELPLESRLHWWRHYYVSNIAIQARAITIWFDFPPNRRAQYKELFEPLQMPWIEAEFRRHSSVLATNGLAWHLHAQDTPSAQCTARVMDDELERYAVEHAAKRVSEQLRRDRAAAVTQLRVARPTVERQFAALRGSTDSPDEQLGQALALAEHLAAIGGRRDAWMSLWSEFSRLKARASESVQLSVALRLGELMIGDDAADTALGHLRGLVPYFWKLVDGDPTKLRFLGIWAAVLRDSCAYSEAIAAFDEVARTTGHDSDRAAAVAEIAEMHLLQGELGKLAIERGKTC